MPFILLFYYFFIFLFGLIIGSFLNCLIWRLHKEESMLGRSYCPKCRAQIAWYDNIPILSYLALGGKCRHCHKKISLQYPIVELSTGILFALAVFINCKLDIINCLQITNYKLQITLLRDWYIIAVMIVIFIYDLRWYLILDKITLPSIVIVFLLNLASGMNWQNMLFSGIIGGSFFLLQFVVSRGKWIGGGDIRLGALMGVALGWPNILMALFIAYIMGSIVGVGMILAKKKQWGSQIPFGVFLSVATLIALFWGQDLINWYLSFILFK